MQKRRRRQKLTAKKNAPQKNATNKAEGLQCDTGSNRIAELLDEVVTAERFRKSV